MTDEEVRTRSAYLFLACSEGVEQLVSRLLASLPAPSQAPAMGLERGLKREVGLLFRYWTTRQIWERLDDHEADAKQLNLALLRLFTDAFHLAKDGSGLHYAELSTPEEEAYELARRIVKVVGVEHQPLLNELRAEFIPWRRTVVGYTKDALELPLDRLVAQIKDWASRLPRQESV